MNTEAVSASADGSCIVWDIERFTRKFALFQPAIFLACTYLPDDSQILTAGTNFKLSYWDAADGSAIRVIDGAKVAVSMFLFRMSYSVPSRIDHVSLTHPETT